MFISIENENVKKKWGSMPARKTTLHLGLRLEEVACQSSLICGSNALDHIHEHLPGCLTEALGCGCGPSLWGIRWNTRFFQHKRAFPTGCFFLTGIPFRESLCDVNGSFFLEFFLDKQIRLG
jgi:hypothetical protein